MPVDDGVLCHETTGVQHALYVILMTQMRTCSSMLIYHTYLTFAYTSDQLGLNGKWNDQNCGVPTPFICKRAEDSITPVTNAPTPTPTGGCNNGYFKYFNRCYRIGGYVTDDRYKWKSARDLCQAEGGNLAGIHDKRVQCKRNYQSFFSQD